MPSVATEHVPSRMAFHSWGCYIENYERLLREMTRSTQHRHVVTYDDILSGEPIISGTRTPVRAIVELWRSGIPPEEIPSHLPHLNMAEIFDALGYYSENQDEINSCIEQNRITDRLLFGEDNVE